MADEIGTKVSQLPLGENLADSDLMYAVEGGISKKVEVGYLKNRLVGNVDSAPTQGSTNLVQSGGVYTALASKADSSAIPTDLADLTDDSTHRTVTDAEKASWDGKSDFSGSYNDLTDKPTIPTVEANPSGEATDELDKIQIGSTIYDIVGGGGGSEPIYGEASGAVASFVDGSDNPLNDLKIEINAVQSGSGDPSPSNPRPISGWTGANVVVSPTLDAEDGTTYTITWQTEAGEVFGGSLDVTSGELVVDAKIFNVNSASLITRIAGSVYRIDKPKYPDGVFNADNIVGLSCDKFKPLVSSSSLDNCYNTVNGLIIRTTTSYETTTELYNSVGEFKFTYQIAEPTTITLTPTQIRSLLGQNNIWADCGDINYLKYQRDLNACINDIIRRIEALENA